MFGAGSEIIQLPWIIFVVVKFNSLGTMFSPLSIPVANSPNAIAGIVLGVGRFPDLLGRIFQRRNQADTGNIFGSFQPGQLRQGRIEVDQFRRRFRHLAHRLNSRPCHNQGHTRCVFK